jgi:hypothetical protein
MSNRMTAAVMCLATIGAMPILAQQKPAAGSTKYDVTIQADGAAYTGTMNLAVAKGKVSGDMHITKPTEITGKAAGTTKAGQMKLDFPYRMVQRGCDGQIAMDIKLPAKAGTGPATGTVSIVGCGRTAEDKLPGTIELKPQAAATKK